MRGEQRNKPSARAGNTGEKHGQKGPQAGHSRVPVVATLRRARAIVERLSNRTANTLSAGMGRKRARLLAPLHNRTPQQPIRPRASESAWLHSHLSLITGASTRNAASAHSDGTTNFSLPKHRSSKQRLPLLETGAGNFYLRAQGGIRALSGLKLQAAPREEEGVNRLPADAHFPVQVRAGDKTGRTHQTNALAFAHALAFADQALGKVHVD